MIENMTEATEHARELLTRENVRIAMRLQTARENHAYHEAKCLEAAEQIEDLIDRKIALDNALTAYESVDISPTGEVAGLKPYTVTDIQEGLDAFD